MKDTFEVGHLNFGAKTQNFELVEQLVGNCPVES